MVVLASAWALPGPAQGQAPHMGQVQKLPVITISMQVGSMDKESKKVTYSPPPGWYVRSHFVECSTRTGNSSFSVNTVPQNWNWCSDDKIQESYKLLMDLAAKAEDKSLANKFQIERNEALAELHRCQASHHALVVDATARGGGFLKGGGSLQLSVIAELVYVGTEADLKKTVAKHIAEDKKTGLLPQAEVKKTLAKQIANGKTNGLAPQKGLKKTVLKPKARPK
jgi:hypothetical protein